MKDVHSSEFYLNKDWPPPLGKAAKKVLFLVAQPLRPLPPPPRLSGHRNFFPHIKIRVFFLVAYPFSPPLSRPATKKRTFFAASLSPLNKSSMVKRKRFLCVTAAAPKASQFLLPDPGVSIQAWMLHSAHAKINCNVFIIYNSYVLYTEFLWGAFHIWFWFFKHQNNCDLSM